LCLAAPAAAAVSAFVLCRYACGRFWPALLGGYIFGFSVYMLSHILAHLVLMLIFPIPLLVYLTLLRIDWKIRRAGFVAGLIAILLLQFLSSTEIFATMTLFAAIALVLAFILVDTGTRSKLVTVTKEIASAYGIVAIVLTPYLYYVFAPGLPKQPNPATVYSNDLLSFVLPPPVLLAGPHVAGSSLGHFFESASWWEQAGYLGPGVWIVGWLFTRSYWRTQWGKLLVLSFALIAVMSMGPTLHAGGKPLARMPWRLFNALPLIKDALPGRFGMYLSLIAAVAAAIYLARAPVSARSRVVLAVLCCLFILPEQAIRREFGYVAAFAGTPVQTRIDMPQFFSSGQYKLYLAPGDNVLVLPLGDGGSNAGMLWQAKSDFYFNTTDWFGVVAPPDSGRWPVMAAFHSERQILDFSEQLDAFLGGHQVKAIIVDSSAPGRWPDILADAGMTRMASGGILFYKVPDSVLSKFRNATPHQMAEKYADACFAALIIAADSYLDRGFPLAQLALAEARRLKLLTLPESQPDPLGDSRWSQNFGLGSWDGLVGIGIRGNYQDLEFLINDYGSEAAAIFFPFPKRMVKRPKRGYGRLLFTFTPAGLERAVRTASIPPRR
jgi:hypothetical protein